MHAIGCSVDSLCEDIEYMIYSACEDEKSSNSSPYCLLEGCSEEKDTKTLLSYLAVSEWIIETKLSSILCSI